MGTNNTNRDEYELTGHEYGKDHVRLLYVEKNGPVHHIREFKVCTRLELRSLKSFVTGDNSEVVATDTQKNTVNVMAKKHGVQQPEMFALLLARHFLQHYPQVIRTVVRVEEVPWSRIERPEGLHDHAFMLCPSVIHFCSVEICRLETGNQGFPLVKAGLRGLRVLKTTQSKFENFHSDDFRTLPDTEERVLATEVTAEWTYSSLPLDSGAAWRAVRDAIVGQFAGPPHHGVMSPSVQYTIFQAQLEAMRQVPQITSLEIHMPNLHYLPLDLGRFKGEAECKEGPGDVLLPSSEPSGHIMARLERRHLPRGKL